MAVQQAHRDQNRVTTLIGVDSVAFTDATTVAVDATTHEMLVKASIASGSTQDVNLTQVGGATITEGQKAMAASLPVVIASDQSALPVTGTFYQATQPVSIASGQVASGAIASGAIASGAAVSGAFADGSNVTLGAKADAKSTATDTTAVTVMQVLKEISFMEQTPASRAVTQATGTNLHAVIDTGSTTAVTQATGTNLHAVIDTGSTTAVTQATGTNLHAVVDSGTITTVTTVTNLGASNAAATRAADGVTPTVPAIANYNFIKTPGANTWDRMYSAVNAANTTGTGVVASGIMAQFDDVSPQTVTENQFGNVRMSANGVLYIMGDIANDAVDAGNPQKIGGYASTAAPTAVSAAADRVNAWFDLNGRLATFAAYSFTNITSNTTTTVKSGVGVLHTIIFNDPSEIGTANETLTIYDNTAGSGTKIGTVNVNDLQAGQTPFSLLYDALFTTGLTIVTASGTGVDITVTYK